MSRLWEKLIQRTARTWDGSRSGWTKTMILKGKTGKVTKMTWTESKDVEILKVRHNWKRKRETLSEIDMKKKKTLWKSERDGKQLGESDLERVKGELTETEWSNRLGERRGHLISDRQTNRQRSYRRDSSDSLCGLASIRPGSWAHLEDRPNGRGGIEWSRCGFEPRSDPVPAPCVWYEGPGHLLPIQTAHFASLCCYALESNKNYYRRNKHAL